MITSPSKVYFWLKKQFCLNFLEHVQTVSTCLPWATERIATRRGIPTLNTAQIDISPSMYSLMSDLFGQELEGFKGHAGYIYAVAGPLNILMILHVTLVWVESFFWQIWAVWLCILSLLSIGCPKYISSNRVRKKLAASEGFILFNVRNVYVCTGDLDPN